MSQILSSRRRRREQWVSVLGHCTINNPLFLSLAIHYKQFYSMLLRINVVGGDSSFSNHEGQDPYNDVLSRNTSFRWHMEMKCNVDVLAYDYNICVLCSFLLLAHISSNICDSLSRKTQQWLSYCKWNFIHYFKISWILFWWSDLEYHALFSVQYMF